MNKDRKNPKRVIFNIKEDIHTDLKIAATRRNMTITQYVLEAIAWRLKSEQK